MSQEQQLCPGVGGRRCGAVISPLFRDPHPTCARCRGKKCTVDVTCDICKDWSVAQWEAFLKKCAYSGRHKSRLQALTFPLLLRPFLPLPRLLRKPDALRLPFIHSPLCQRGVAVRGVGGWPRVRSCEVSSPPSRRSFGDGDGGVGGGVLGAVRVLVSGGASDSAAFFLPGVGVAGSSLSLSGITCARCPFLGSLFCLCWAWSSIALSRGWGFYREPLPLFTVFSLTRSSVDVGALTGILHTPLLPMCGLGGSGHGFRTTTGLVEFARTFRVTVRGLDNCTRVRLAGVRPGVTVRGHTGPATGRVTVAGHGTGHPSPLTVRGRGRRVASLGGVAGIARRLLLPPGIAVTLGRGWSLPLW